MMAMAQQLAQDPAFMEMTQQLQQQMGGLMGGAPGGGLPGGAPGGGAPTMPNPEQYMEMMQGMMNNPAVMQMSQRMFEQMQGEPAMARMMSAMSDPASRNELEAKIKTLRDEDPELAEVIDEIEKGGPQAMMKYWSDPEVLSKLGKGMEKVLEEHLGGEAAGAGGAAAAEAEAEEDEEVIVNYAWEAAQLGDPDALRELLEQEADKDEVDDEGRSGLHFACGYGELECAQVLIDAKANLNVTDAKDNTPLHYAAGYGQLEPVKMLVGAGADISLKNKDGHTAQEIAKMNAQEEIMKLLVAK